MLIFESNSGTGVGLVNDEMTVKDMLEEVRGEAIAIMSSLRNSVN